MREWTLKNIAGRCENAPPMLGLEDEMIVLRSTDIGTEVGNLVDHYTALINGHRVFVFFEGRTEWCICACPDPMTYGHTNMRRQCGPKDDTHVPRDPFMLRFWLHKLTSGGNDDT